MISKKAEGSATLTKIIVIILIILIGFLFIYGVQKLGGKLISP